MIENILPGFAAIDLGASEMFVAATGRPVKKFRTFTSELYALTQWLREQGVHSVAMEATGVEWINPHDLLEGAGFKVTLFHGAHARNLPGRKTDVQDCQWHAMLHSHGLLSPCFVPPEEVRMLRTFSRLREDHLEMASSHLQKMQRALSLMNVQIHRVLSQVQGVNSLRMIEAILAGERDPLKLVQLCDSGVRKRKEKELLLAVEGHWQDHHLFELRQAYECYQFYQRQVEACDQQAERQLERMAAVCPPVARKPEAKVKPTRHNPPAIDGLYDKLLTLSGGNDLQQISGIGCLSWLKLSGELGFDLSRWKNEKHFTSWIGLAPNHHQSGKRRRRVPRRKTRAGQIFREMVMSLERSKDVALGDFYRRKKASRGAAVAVVATARKLAELYYRVMTRGMEFVEKGIAEYAKQRAEQTERYLRRKAAKLGFILQPATAPATAIPL